MKLLEFYKKYPQLKNKNMNELFSTEFKFVENKFVQHFLFKKGLPEDVKNDLRIIFSL